MDLDDPRYLLALSALLDRSGLAARFPFAAEPAYVASVLAPRLDDIDLDLVGAAFEAIAADAERMPNPASIRRRCAEIAGLVADEDWEAALAECSRMAEWESSYLTNFINRDKPEWRNPLARVMYGHMGRELLLPPVDAAARAQFRESYRHLAGCHDRTVCDPYVGQLGSVTMAALTAARKELTT